MKREIPSKRKIKPSIRRNSLLAALMIAFNILCAVLQHVMQLSISYGNLLGSLIITLVFLFHILDRKIVVLSPKLLMLCQYIICAMLISWLFVGIKTDKYIISFVFFGLIGCYIGSQEIDVELVLRYLIYFSYLPLLVMEGLMELHYRESLTSARLDMGISYALLPMVFAALLHYIYYSKKANIVLKTGYIINAIILVILLLAGTRGGVLSILVFFILVFVNQYSKESNASIRTHKKRRTWLIWLSICTGLIIAFFSNQIILAASQFFSGIGLHINIIEKTAQLISSTGDSTNGRIVLWKIAARSILKNPIWGYGWGSFLILTSQTHPHNIILELMYEGGILLALPILFQVFRGVKKCILGQISNREDYVYATLLIATSLPRLMVSASLWNHQVFWMMLAFMVMRIPNNTQLKKPILNVIAKA
jgi:O-antigen ligase